MTSIAMHLMSALFSYCFYIPREVERLFEEVIKKADSSDVVAQMDCYGISEQCFVKIGKNIQQTLCSFSSELPSFS